MARHVLEAELPVECPLCRTAFESNRCVLKCGHHYCQSCVQTCVLDNDILCNTCGVECGLAYLVPVELVVAIKTLSQKTYLHCVSPHDSITTLMEQIQDSQGVPLDQQRLLMGGRSLEHRVDVSMQSLGFCTERPVYMVLKLNGD